MSKLLEFKQSSQEMAHIPLYLKEISEESFLENPLFFHMNKYPLVQFSDVYKFIYQGTCGWSHLTNIGNEEHIKSYLKDEL